MIHFRSNFASQGRERKPVLCFPLVKPDQQRRFSGERKDRVSRCRRKSHQGTGSQPARQSYSAGLCRDGRNQLLRQLAPRRHGVGQNRLQQYRICRHDHMDSTRDSVTLVGQAAQELCIADNSCDPMRGKFRRCGRKSQCFLSRLCFPANGPAFAILW